MIALLLGSVLALESNPVAVLNPSDGIRAEAFAYPTVGRDALIRELVGPPGRQTETMTPAEYGEPVRVIANLGSIGLVTVMIPSDRQPVRSKTICRVTIAGDHVATFLGGDEQAQEAFKEASGWCHRRVSPEVVHLPHIAMPVPQPGPE